MIDKGVFCGVEVILGRGIAGIRRCRLQTSLTYFW